MPASSDPLPADLAMLPPPPDAGNESPEASSHGSSGGTGSGDGPGPCQLLDDELLDELPPEDELLELGELLDEEGPDELLDETPLDDDELLGPPEDELLEEKPLELDDDGPVELLDEIPLDEELDDDELLQPPEDELLGDDELLEIGGVLEDDELGEVLLELDRLPLLLELIDQYSPNLEWTQLRPVLRDSGAMSSAKGVGGR